MSYTDSGIQKDITDELAWEPSLRDDDIAVGVRDGVVTLGGFVDSYAEKIKAERTAGRVRGVKAIANELQVKLLSPSERTDPDIARAALTSLTWNLQVPHDRIRVTVEKGWITLQGEVDRHYQRDAAERSVRFLIGVRGVTNLITLTVAASPKDLKRQIKAALHRAVDLDADRINVEVEGHKVTLTGSVRSYAELKDAERAAHNAPGITAVENRLAIISGLIAV